MPYKISLFVLYLLVLLGLYGAFTLSLNSFLGSSICPSVYNIPLCYVVFFSYGMMFVTLSLKNHIKAIFFLSACFVVFLIALIGTFLELFLDNICPINKLEIPLCYLSLFIVIVIFALFMKIKNK
ncbi:MAG: hypothetical protein COA66_06855 [Arcobacter sp.]|nr:MAG: hypothetical protein COA66_06855 [Arcobacter sp.]